MGADLLALEQAPADGERLRRALRAAHTLKGAARLAGVGSVERLTHALEAALSEARSGRVRLDGSMVDTLLSALDAVRSGVAAAAQGLTVQGLGEAEGRIHALLSGSAPRAGGVEAVFPGLGREVKAVLSEYQDSLLLAARENGRACWELEFSAGSREWGRRVGAVHRAAEGLGDVVAIVGLSSGDPERARFSLLLAARADVPAVRDFIAREGLTARRLEEAADGPVSAANAQDEAAFLAEMAQLREQFLLEKGDELEQALPQLVALEKSPDDTELLNALFRWAHNLKGAAMTYGYPNISVLGRSVETVLGRLRERSLRVQPHVTDALLRASDALRDLLAEARQGRTPEVPAAALGGLEAALAPEASLTPAAGPAAQGMRSAARSSRESIRVRIEKLDRLVNLVGEMTTERNVKEALLRELGVQVGRVKSILRDGAPALGELADRVARLESDVSGLFVRFESSLQASEVVVSELQREVLSVRMLPLSLLFETAPRLVRDLTRGSAKEVSLEVEGGGTEVDKEVLEAMADPLVHLLRNAVDHGIEPREARRRVGKSPAGVVRLRAEQRGSQVSIAVSDDGGGIDPSLVARKAAAKGLLSSEEAERLPREQALALIFLPGFSTKEQVTDVSGRGVGMDVVKTNVENLRGSIEIETSPGRGTTFLIRLPVNLAVVPILFVRCAGQTYGLQTSSVTEVLRIAESEIESEDARACFPHRGQTLPIVRLAELLGLPAAPSGDPLTVVVARGLEGGLGLVVDEASEEMPAVLKGLGSLLGKSPHVSGATILPDGRAALVLDAASLLGAAIKGSRPWVEASPPVPRAARKTLLVADDSATTRHMLCGLLEGFGYEVVTARDGQEALALLEGRRVDLVLSDVDMPILDGYRLTETLRASRRFASLPVILLTSFASDAEKLRGLQAGADAYLVKSSFDQSFLRERIRELAGEAA